MSQIRVSEEEKVDLGSLDDLRQQFGELSEKKDEYRVVTLKYKSCCGCGCSYSDIRRTVPMNSSLNDGDIVKDLEEDDEWL